MHATLRHSDLIRMYFNSPGFCWYDFNGYDGFHLTAWNYVRQHWNSRNSVVLQQININSFYSIRYVLILRNYINSFKFRQIHMCSGPPHMQHIPLDCDLTWSYSLSINKIIFVQNNYCYSVTHYSEVVLRAHTHTHSQSIMKEKQHGEGIQVTQPCQSL